MTGYPEVEIASAICRSRSFDRRGYARIAAPILPGGANSDGELNCESSLIVRYFEVAVLSADGAVFSRRS
jgi:hypothetical protein